MSTKTWKIKEVPDATIIEKLQKEINVSPLMAILLAQRGITNYDEAKAFFRPNLADLHDPFLMKDMDFAISRLQNALEKDEKIMIYGDYDVDGTTSVALVYSFLSTFYDNLVYYIPDRYKEGYGISIAGIDEAQKLGVSLIIALDCGIKAIDKVQYANKKNIDFIICDHHLPGKELPQAAAILDPKRNDCQYPYKELSGCGIGFKLMQAFVIKTNGNEQKLFQLLDLVAISIACDIVPITGENRILAYYGLEHLNNKPRKGIAELLKLSGREGKADISTLVFYIGPRINAAGRINHGKKAVELLVSESTEGIEYLGNTINEFNNTRKETDIQIKNEALEMISSNERFFKSKSTVLFSSNWHKGVIGIVASRVIEEHYKPTILLTESDGFATGSARSVSGFDIYKAIEACADLLEQFGGHKYAAGLTLKTENIEAFRDKFEEIVSATITEEQTIPVVNIDAEADFNEITPKFYETLQQMAPFGPGNMLPVFVTKNVVDAGFTKIVGSDQSHLKLHVCQEKNPSLAFGGIAFGQAKYVKVLSAGKPIDVAYNLELNTFNNQTKLELMVREMRESNSL